MALYCPPPPPDGKCPPDANLHTVSFESNMRPSTVYFTASAEAHGFTQLSIMGTGKSATWGKGMQHKLNSYRNYLQANVCDCDIVLLIDAGDVLILGSPGEVKDRFEMLEAKRGLSVFFGGEVICTEWAIPVCKPLDELTKGRGDWRFLNSGLIAGRGSVLKRIFPEPLTEVIKHDQEWFRSYFLEHHDELGLGIDYQTDLFIVIGGVEGVWSGDWIDLLGQPKGSIGLEQVGAELKVVNTRSHTYPLIAHFPGVGKWQAWIPGDRSTTVARRANSFPDAVWHFFKGDVESCALHELFLTLFPKEAKALKMTQLERYTWLRALPDHRPTCVSLDNLSPWGGFDVLFNTASWFALTTFVLQALLSVACVALLISCKAAWVAKKGSRLLPNWFILWLRRYEERAEDVEMKAL